MKRSCLLTLLFTALAAQAAPDALLFCRGERAWYLPADATTPEPLVDEDPGWVYEQPTWVDYERVAVMRLKGGEALRSHVGLVEQVGHLPIKPDEVGWIKSAGGALGIGSCPDYAKLAYTKVSYGKEDSFEPFLSVGPVDGQMGKPRSLGVNETGDVGGPRARIRFAPDGNRAVVPSFPSDVSATVTLWDVAKNRDDDPYWLRWSWLTENGGDGAVSCIGWLRGGRILLGTLTSGLYQVDTKTKTITKIDTWEMGKASVTELSVSADRTRAYYSVTTYGDNGESASEIRLLDANGKTSTVLKNASSPDARPAAG